MAWKIERWMFSSVGEASRPFRARGRNTVRQGLSGASIKSMFPLRKTTQWWTSSVSGLGRINGLMEFQREISVSLLWIFDTGLP